MAHHLIGKLGAALAGIVFAHATQTAFAQTAKEIRGATPYVALQNEPAPKLILDPPLPEQLAMGIFQIQYRVENVHIMPVFGTGALSVSPRVGHLHVTVDDLSWHWADASDTNTIDIVGLSPGPHKVLIQLVDATHHPFPDQSYTVAFKIPEAAEHKH